MNDRITAWSIHLLDYSFDVKYKAGITSDFPDWLSRESLPDTFDDIKVLQEPKFIDINLGRLLAIYFLQEETSKRNRQEEEVDSKELYFIFVTQPTTVKSH